MDGIIKKYYDDRGFGFIKADDRDFFFHVSDVVNGTNSIVTGIRVRFDVGSNNKGEKAENVKIISDSKFITIDNTRIKMSNIKEYGVSKAKPSYKTYVYTLEEYKETQQEPKKKGIIEALIEFSMEMNREANRNVSRTVPRKYILKKTTELVDVCDVAPYEGGIWSCDLDEPFIAMIDNFEYYDKWLKYEDRINNTSTETSKKPFDAGDRHTRKIVRDDSFVGHVFASKWSRILL